MEVIFLRIAIQKGLEELKNELEQRGYDIFYIGENKMADAVLYKEADPYLYYEVNNIPSPASASMEDAAFGALLINITNKSTDEIVNILKRRTYSPLF